MKKFKNSLNVRGSNSLLKAFIEELEKLEYKQNKSNNSLEIIESVVTYRLGVYNLFNNFNNGYGGDNVQLLNLPQDWNKALELAAELEKQEPDLYTDEDLVYLDGKKEELFIGDTYYYIHKGSSSIEKSSIVKDFYKHPTVTRFKTEQAAKDYISLQKAIKESGLKVGDKFFGQGKYFGLSTDVPKFMDALGTFKSLNCYIKSFRIIENKPCLISDYWAIILNTIVSDKLTFGGNEVTLKKENNTVLITCKGVTGTYEELLEISVNYIDFKSKYNCKFGTERLKLFTINNNEVEPELSEVLDDDSITIGCTTGTVKEFRNILKECKLLLEK